MLEPEDSDEVQSVLFDLLPFTAYIYDACLAVPPPAAGQPKIKRPPLVDEKSALVLAKVVFCLAGDGVGPREAASIAGLKNKDDSGVVDMSLLDFQTAIARVERGRQYLKEQQLLRDQLRDPLSQREKGGYTMNGGGSSRTICPSGTTSNASGALGSGGGGGAAGGGGGWGVGTSAAGSGGGSTIANAAAAAAARAGDACTSTASAAASAMAAFSLQPDDFIMAATRAAHLADGVMQRVLAMAAPGGPASRLRAEADVTVSSEGEGGRRSTSSVDAVGNRVLSPRQPPAGDTEDATLAGGQGGSGRASPSAPDTCGLSKMAAPPEHLTEYFKTLNLEEDDALRLASLSTAHGVDVNLLSGLGQRSIDIKRRKDYFVGTAPVTTAHKSVIETMGSMIRGN
eukprot:jgi/Mesvir1/15002/Mv14660-RA.1